MMAGSIPLSLNFDGGAYRLRGYQIAAVNSGLKYFRDEKANYGALMVMPTGAGKSLIIAGMAKELGRPTLIFQPSKEILEQNYAKLLSYGQQASIYSASMNSKVTSGLTLATIGSVINHRQAFKEFEYVIIDECFVAGTKIDGKPIEDIIPGDLVSSFNHEKGIIERKRVLATSKRPAPTIFISISAGGTALLCSENHPIYAKGREYIAANNIKEGDVLYGTRKNANNTAAMHRMRQAGTLKKLSPILEIQKDWADIPQGMQPHSNVEGFSCEDAGEKSNGPEIGSPEDGGFSPQDWPPATRKGRKRNGLISAAGEISKSIRQWLDPRVCRENGQKAQGRLSASLQNRYRQYLQNDRSRGGWRISFFKKGARRKKGVSINFLRVEGIEIQKQGSDGKFPGGNRYDHVYNLEVEGNNNYFANGILVHNCHYVNAKGGMYRDFLGDHNGKMLGLTATPYRLITDGFGGSILKFLTRTRPRIFERIIHITQNGDLFKQGFLGRLEYKQESGFDAEQLSLNSTGADYTDSSVRSYYKQIGFADRLYSAVAGCLLKGRKNILVFTRFVEESKSLIERLGPAAEIVTGETPRRERESIVARFRAGGIKVVSNVGVLTHGFDFPELETIVIGRPTMSLGLYYQMIGRGVRIHPQKECTWVIDLCDNYRMFGRVEDLRLHAQKPGLWVISSSGRQLTNIYYGERNQNFKKQVHKMKMEASGR